MSFVSLLNSVPNVPYMPYVPYVLTRPTSPTCSTCPTCPPAQVYFTDQKIKNIGFNEIKLRFVHWCFQGCWILIWTFLKIGSKNIQLFYAEGQKKKTLINAEGKNNTYKCWRSKQHYKTIKDMLKVRNTSRHL